MKIMRAVEMLHWLDCKLNVLKTLNMLDSLCVLDMLNVLTDASLVC